MQNLNNHLLCAIDVETTGLDYRENEICQIAIIPLDVDLKPDPKRMPFLLDMIPLKTDNINSEAMRINRMKLCEIISTGTHPHRAQDLFLEWFEQQKLPFRKQIIPLGCNYAFDRSFIIEWLGPATYELCFNGEYRDLMTAASFVNDIAGWRAEEFPYPHVSLTRLCTKFNVERTKAHDATDDARVTAECYRKMIVAN